MFTKWQVLIFSLVPLALVFIGVIGSSFHGQDSAREVFPTPAPLPTATPGARAPSDTAFSITAENLMFSTGSLTAAASSPITVQLDNRDADVLHNFAIYSDRSLSQKLFGGDLYTGPGSVEYAFTTPAAGTYFFRCDVHTDTVKGDFSVRPAVAELSRS